MISSWTLDRKLEVEFIIEQILQWLEPFIYSIDLEVVNFILLLEAFYHLVSFEFDQLLFFFLMIDPFSRENPVMFGDI